MSPFPLPVAELKGSTSFPHKAQLLISPHKALALVAVSLRLVLLALPSEFSGADGRETGRLVTLFVTASLVLVCVATIGWNVLYPTENEEEQGCQDLSSKETTQSCTSPSPKRAAPFTPGKSAARSLFKDSEDRRWGALKPGQRWADVTPDLSPDLL